ncbi:MAG: VCBS repeat-containing protein [Planctomycetes bacterium]|nr:VCBS repeat-containing protein [Planctomycetota bacterium]
MHTALLRASFVCAFTISLGAQSCERAAFGIAGVSQCLAGACRYGDDLAIGDFDGDGTVDIISGAPMAVPPTAFVRSVRDGTLVHVLTGVAGSRFGTVCDCVDDIDFDGVDDFAVSAPYENNSTGVVRLYSGASGRLLRALAGSTQLPWFGGYMAGLGDVDGDGAGDLIVGGLSDTYARVVSGATGSTIYAYSTSARAVGRCGDVNGDWCADFAIGPGPAGLVTIYSGFDGSILRTVAAPFAANTVGIALAAAGDIDRDGRPDLLVGTPNSNGGPGIASGAVFVISGATGSILFTKLGYGFNTSLGWSVAGGGDVDRDGYPDFAAGGPGDATGGSSAGRIDVFSGRTGGLLFSRFGGPGDWMGTACSLADTDGNGATDLVAGSSLDPLSVPFPVSGSIRVFEHDIEPWLDELPAAEITVFAGSAVSVPVSARDVSCTGLPLSLSVSGQPADGLFSLPLPAAAAGSTPSITTVFCWTPGGDDIGRHTMLFTATDGAQHTTTMTVEINVVAGLLMLGLAPADVPIDGVDRLLVDVHIWAPIAGTGMPTILVPDLVGLHVFAQVAMFSPELFPQDPLQLSQGLEVVVGTGTTAYGVGGSGIVLGLDQLPLPSSLVSFHAVFP